MIILQINRGTYFLQHITGNHDLRPTYLAAQCVYMGNSSLTSTSLDMSAAGDSSIACSSHYTG